VRTARACPRPAGAGVFCLPGGRGWRGRSACRTLRGAVFLCLLPLREMGKKTGGDKIIRRRRCYEKGKVAEVLRVVYRSRRYAADGPDGAQRVSPHGGDRLGDLPHRLSRKGGHETGQLQSLSQRGVIHPGHENRYAGQLPVVPLQVRIRRKRKHRRHAQRLRAGIQASGSEHGRGHRHRNARLRRRRVHEQG